MKTIGLTGIMGAGKSTVIDVLKQAGITVLDCDEINHELMKPGHLGYVQLIQAFGKAIVNDEGLINRQYLANHIFQNEAMRKQVEDILHPLIQAEIRKAIAIHQKEAIIVVEVPLLFEIQWQYCFDETWVVNAEKAVLLSRLTNLRGVPENEVKRRWKLQMGQAQKCALADKIIDNSGSIEALKQQIQILIQSEG